MPLFFVASSCHIYRFSGIKFDNILGVESFKFSLTEVNVNYGKTDHCGVVDFTFHALLWAEEVYRKF